MTARRDKIFTIRWAERELNLGEKTLIMGVLNVTPDSFSDGGLFFRRDKAIEQALALVGDGADILDIGGESTRPYSEAVSVDEEMERVIPVIEAIKKEVSIPISIDTCKAKVALEALKAGASLVNDISSLRFDPEITSIISEAGVPVILMHMKGTPGNMQDKPSYNNLVEEIIDFLKDAMDRAVKGGIEKDKIIVDPGIGFGKTLDHNLEIIRELSRFSELDRPILIGTSRKAFIGKILDKQPLERDTGTMATVSAAILNGAHIIRVHNVKKALDTVKIVDAIRMAGRARGNRWK